MHVVILLQDSLVGPWEQSRAIDILLAKDVMAKVPREGCLRQRESVQTIIRLLSGSAHNAYIVVEDTHAGATFMGLVTRRQLCLILDNGCYGLAQQCSTSHRRESATITSADLATAYPHFPEIEVVERNLPAAARKQMVDLGPFMSPTPYTIAATAPLARVLHLFQPMGLRHLPVVDQFNSVVGMITRKDLVEHALEETLGRLAAINNRATLQRMAPPYIISTASAGASGNGGELGPPQQQQQQFDGAGGSSGSAISMHSASSPSPTVSTGLSRGLLA